MSVFEYLELQPIETQEGEALSELDQYKQDDIIDLSADEDGETLMSKLDAMCADIQNQDSHA